MLNFNLTGLHCLELEFGNVNEDFGDRRATEDSVVINLDVEFELDVLWALDGFNHTDHGLIVISGAQVEEGLVDGLD